MRNIMRAIARAIRQALRSVGGAFASAYEWASDAWDYVEDSPVGPLLTAAKLPFATAAATVGLGEALLSKRDVARIGLVADATADVVSRAGRGAVAAAGHVGTVAAAAVSDAVALPGKLVRAVLGGGGGGAPSPQAAAGQAAQQEVAKQKAADDSADDRAALAALRRVASAVGRGERPAAIDVEAVPPGLASYLVKLDPEEAAIVARARTTALRALLSGGVAPEGVRSPKDLSADLAVAVAPAPVDRKADFRARLAARREAEDNLAEAYAA